MIVTPIHPAEATGLVAEIYAGDIDDIGFVYQHTQAMALNPEAWLAFEALARTIVPSIGLRTYELVTLGAARTLRSTHCLLAHGRRSVRAEVLDENQVIDIARGEGSAGLSAADEAVLAYAERVSTDAAQMSDADSRALRDVGFSDRQIVDITLAAALRNYLSRSLQALAVPVDDLPGLSKAMTDALVAAGQAPRAAQP